MTHKTATVTETRRYDKADPGYTATLDCAPPHSCTIHLDSPQWFAWLEAPENDSFSYALHNHAKGYIDGFMTVRKERRKRGGAYWSAYRRQGRRLRKLYLGTSSSLTAAPPHLAPAWPRTPAQLQLQLQPQLQLQLHHKGGKTCCHPNPNPAAPQSSAPSRGRVTMID